MDGEPRVAIDPVMDYVPGAVNYKGNPAERTRTGGWISAALILVIELNERLSTMGIAVNLVTYLGGTMHLPSATSANIVSDFMGTSFLLCLLGGFLADSFLGRFKTVAIFSVIQAAGTCLLAMSTKLPQLRPPPCVNNQCQRATSSQMSVFYLSLYIIALGTGGLKSSVSGFGSDQFDEKNEKEKTQKTYFFNRFFFFITTGTLLAVTVLVYIQDEVGRSWSYGICSMSMVIAIVIFLTGRRKYRYKKCMGSPIVHILQVLVAALKKRNLEFPINVSYLYENSDEHSKIPHTNQFIFLDKASLVSEGDYMPNSSKPNPWKLCSVTSVEEVKMMIRLLPIWATTIIFWTVYAQMITFSVEQATTMDRAIGSFKIPAGSLTVFFVAGILITLAVYDRLIIPLWKKWRGKQGLSDFQRMAIGLIFSILGMVAASLVEIKRLSVVRSTGARGHDTPLPISVFYLAPQFFLIGTGEGLIYTGQLDFFISRSPKGMKTVSTGLFLSTLALGFFVSSFLVNIVKGVTGGEGKKGWLPADINDGRLDYFYGLLSVLSFINFVLYLISAAWCKSHKSSQELEMKSSEKKPTVEEKC